MCRETNINFECYDIRENGTIFSKHWNKQLTGCLDRDGYTFIKLKLKNGSYDQFRLHRVIWAYFNGEIPDDKQIDHIIPISNGGTNELSNLRLATPKENSNNPTSLINMSNSQRGLHHNMPHNIPSLSKQRFQYTLEGELVKVWPSAKEAARNGYNDCCINACCNGTQQTHKGFIWSYQ